MRRLTIVCFALAAALATASAAGAGCFATAGLTPLPEGVVPGET